MSIRDREIDHAMHFILMAEAMRSVRRLIADSPGYDITGFIQHETLLANAGLMGAEMNR